MIKLILTSLNLNLYKNNIWQSSTRKIYWEIEIDMLIGFCKTLTEKDLSILTE